MKEEHTTNCEETRRENKKNCDILGVYTAILNIKTGEVRKLECESKENLNVWGPYSDLV